MYKYTRRDQSIVIEQKIQIVAVLYMQTLKDY